VLRIAGIEWQGPKIVIARGLEITISQRPAVGRKAVRPYIILTFKQHLYLTRAIRANPIQA
jgi:hypothetical protein